MHGRISTVLVLAVVLILSGGLAARDMESFDKTIPADSDVKKVSLESDIGVAHLTITTHDGGDLLTAEARYDADRMDVDVEYEKHKSEAEIFVVAEKTSRWLEIDSDDCIFDISLSRDYVWDLDLDIGFTDSDMDFSGLPLEGFRMDVGASECEVVFDRLNPERIRKMDIDAGAGELKLLGLGYANFEHLVFDGGAGEFVLNFDGLEKGFHTAEIDIGVGEVRIEIPKGLPVRVTGSDSWLSSFRVKGSHLEEVDDGVYETEDFDRADYGLEIDLDVGIGKATIGYADGSGTILTVKSNADVHYGWQGDRHGIHLPALPQLPELPELPPLPPLPSLSELPPLPPLPALPELPPLPVIPEPSMEHHRVLE